MPARSILRPTLACVLALGLVGGGCTDRAIHDDHGPLGDEAAGDEAAGDEAAGGDPGSLAGQGITVLSTYYEGSIMIIEITTHPDASCDELFPFPLTCDERLDQVWHASLELVGDRAAEGAYGELDLSFSEVAHLESGLNGQCLKVYPPVTSSPLGDLVLTIEHGSTQGVSGRVDGLHVYAPEVMTIAGRFDATPCQ